MKRLLLVALSAMLALALAVPVLADGHGPQVRAVHASPDAPAVDVWVDGSPAFTNAPFTGITPYAMLSEGMHNFQIVPAGATEPVVIEADLDLRNDKDYTIVALGTLENIEPLVLEDNNALPEPGMAHVRFVHASPDAPAVDIAVAGGGPTLFAGVAFKEVGTYLPVAAGTYDLDVIVSGTDTVALSVPGLTLEDGTVYTVFAMGLAGGEPALTAIPSADAMASDMAILPATGGNVLGMVFTALAASGVGLALLKKRK